jgi:hypothetical protein
MGLGTINALASPQPAHVELMALAQVQSAGLIWQSDYPLRAWRIKRFVHEATRSTWLRIERPIFMRPENDQRIRLQEKRRLQQLISPAGVSRTPDTTSLVLDTRKA